MGKLPPQKRWERHVMERFTALQQSGELKKLRKQGLAALDRRKLLTGEEWWRTFGQRAASGEYREWHEECRLVGERFGLAPGVVTMACLVKGYRPEEEPLEMAVEWPQVRVVTESTDGRFLARLAYEAQRLGLYVVQRQGSVETTHIVTGGAMAEPPPLPPTKPASHSVFRLRVEVPAGYPPEAARELQTKAARAERRLRERLGYRVSQRLRTSPLVSEAEALKVGEGSLPSGGIYGIVDEVYGTETDLSQDQRRRRIVKSRRHRLRKRLVEPHDARAQAPHSGSPPETAGDASH